MREFRVAMALAAVFLGGSALVHAETGYDAWLRYAPLGAVARVPYARLPTAVFAPVEIPGDRLGKAGTPARRARHAGQDSAPRGIRPA